jgi:hypothetical protein
MKKATRGVALCLAAQQAQARRAAFTFRRQACSSGSV